MATTTPNFGWAVPTSTDLVKDGAVAIETLGDSIDASLVDLKGGTTGQVLSKASNTDMDFTWVTDAAGDITGVTAGTGISGGGTSGTVTVTNSMATAITTAGDLIKGTGSGTFDRLGIGSTGQVLTVSGGAPTWATPAAGGGGKVLQVVQATTSTAVQITATSMQDTGITCSITPTSATSKVLVLINGQVYAYKASNGATGDFQIVRNSTAVLVCDGTTGNFAFGTKVGSSTVESAHIISTAYLDSPATTSSVTYKLQAACNQADELNWQNTNANTSTIVLMEIGA